MSAWWGVFALAVIVLWGLIERSRGCATIGTCNLCGGRVREAKGYMIAGPPPPPGALPALGPRIYNRPRCEDCGAESVQQFGPPVAMKERRDP